VILAEPPPTQGDIHFRVFGIPVRIHPFFWVISLIIAIQGSSTPPAVVFSWIVAVFVSILIHELGHAFMQRRYGGNPRIVLHGMGGLAICDDCDRSSRSQILISLAGPGAGFVFAAAILLLVRVSGHRVGMSFADQLTADDVLSFKSRPEGQSIFGLLFYWEEFASPFVNRMLKDLLWINILWGAINLLPIYPLDGGHVSREVCQLRDPREGMILSLRISVIAAVAMAVVGLSWSSFFMVLMFGYFAYSSYKTLEAYRASLW